MPHIFMLLHTNSGYCVDNWEIVNFKPLLPIINNINNCRDFISNIPKNCSHFLLLTFHIPLNLLIITDNCFICTSYFYIKFTHVPFLVYFSLALLVIPIILSKMMNINFLCGVLRNLLPSAMLYSLLNITGKALQS